MQLRKKIAVGAFVLASSAAMAGLVGDLPVSVTLNGDGSGSAIGLMTTARQSKNNVEYIGCGVRRFEDGLGGVFEYGFCQASTATAVVGFCETENPGLIASVGDLDDYSFITFAWNAAGICQSIGNSTQSQYIPK
ncbi:MAG TPA: hypothetical protein VLD59_00915 [Steroidobacteraceae bacterium]|nr:hypothetical protein [Steroidobacteraceae bacterium]